MNEPILLYTYIYERAEVHHISHSAFEHHARTQVIHGQHVLAEYWLWKLIPRVATGPLKRFNDIFQRRQANIEPLSPILSIQGAQPLTKLSPIAFRNVVHGKPQFCQ